MKVDVKIDRASMAAMVKNLGNISENIKVRALRQGGYKLTQHVARGAKARAPKGETGLLKRSIKAKVGRIRKGRFRAWAGVDVNVEGTDSEGRKRKPANYAHLVHDGFKHPNGQHIPGRPFMRQAVNTLPNNGLNIMADEVAAAAKRYSKK